MKIVKNIPATDEKIITFFRTISMPLARIALFVVFFWFGILKVFGMSPASTLVHDLYLRTVSFIPFTEFYIGFALLECAIGIMFLFPRLTRIVIPFLFVHMIATFLPLFMLPHETFSSFLVPTLEGQYIIKNLVIIAVAVAIAAHLTPLPQQTIKVF